MQWLIRFRSLALTKLNFPIMLSLQIQHLDSLHVYISKSSNKSSSEIPNQIGLIHVFCSFLLPQVIEFFLFSSLAKQGHAKGQLPSLATAT